MHTLTITCELDTEQFNAITTYAAKAGVNLTPELFFQEQIMTQVQYAVDIAYNEAVRMLGEAAKTLPYEQRSALIAQVASMI